MTLADQLPFHRSSFLVPRSPFCFFLSAFYFLLSAFPAFAQTPPSTPTSTAPSPRETQYYIGVAVVNISPAIGRLMNLAPGQGLLIEKVVPGSPAAQASLQTGDLLISINGQPLTAQRQLVDVTNSLEQSPHGLTPKPARVAYVREGKQTTVQLTPAARPASLLVTGNTNGFTPDTANTHANPLAFAPVPNNASIQIGPGIIIDLGPAQAAAGNTAATQNLTLNTQSVQQALSQGQSIVFSQETNSLGNVHYTLTLGNKTFDIDPNHLENLPPDLRPLAEPLFARRITVSPGNASFAETAATQTIAWLEERVAAQDRKIDELTQKINTLLEQLNEKVNAPHP